VEKSARRLTLWYAGSAVREFKISLGSEPIGHKSRAGDGRTPEGQYWIVARNRRSPYHRSLRISYPSPSDQLAAMRAGYLPGGAIMIHGLPRGASWIGKNHAGFDWTRGCIAVTNEEIDEIWELVADGTPIEIRP
jgi:murein L,D-transpeptidase YafK